MANPADIQPQSGRFSAFAYAKQTTPGTYATPTDIINTGTFSLDNDFENLPFKTLSGSLVGLDETRAGLQDVMAKLTEPGRLVQGMGLIASGFGFDTTITGAPIDWGVLNAGVAAGVTSFVLAATPAAPPAGVADWKGAIIHIHEGSKHDYTPVLNLATATVTCLALQNSYTTAATVTVLSNHAAQDKVGTTAAVRDLYSLMCQYAQIFERQVVDAFVSRVGFKGDDKFLNWDLDLESNAGLQYEGAITTTPPTPSSAEANDSPFVMRDGGLISKYAEGDDAPVMHNYLTALDTELTYTVDKQAVNNPTKSTYVKTLTDMVGKITFRELAAQYGGQIAIKQSYADTKIVIPVWIYHRNPITGYAQCMYFERCVVNKYNGEGPSEKPIAYTGDIDIERNHSGATMRLWLYSPVTAVY